MPYGPVPKRSEERIRRNEPDIPITKIQTSGPVVCPALEIDKCHPMVADLYESIATSAQSRYFEPSDWQYARIACYLLDGELRKGRGSASAVQIANITSMLGELLVSEGARRRLRMEIERPDNSPTAEVVSVSDMLRARMAAG